MTAVPAQHTASRITTVVPAPVSARPRPRDDYPITAATRIYAAGDATAIGDYLAGVLRPSTGFPLPVVDDQSPDGGIALLLDGHGDGGSDGGGGEPGESGESDRDGKGGGYRLTVERAGVTLRAATPAGLFAGAQTLRQLLPSRVDSGEPRPGPWVVSGGEIVDYPRFAHRGVMLDVARHFFAVDDVLRLIDQVAQYKINVLHLHLTDDQGWRIEIKSWPRLATHGGATAVGGGPGGHYTQRQYRELVAYAAARHITIVPEVDMPGHTNAALASYAELNRDGVAPQPYTGINVGFSSLCVDKEITYRFVDDVLGELAALTPGEYLHIGADEADATPEAEYVTFINRVLPLVAAHGKTPVGWHEFLKATPPASAVAQYWREDTDVPLVADAVARGNRILLSPADRVYLDMKYNEDTRLGLVWAGCVDVDDAYGWDPGSHLSGVPESAVLGVEAPLWSETLETYDDIEFMLFPRLPAVAELGWSPRGTHDAAAFMRRLAAQEHRWTAQGINFYRSSRVTRSG